MTTTPGIEPYLNSTGSITGAVSESVKSGILGIFCLDLGVV